MARRNYKRDNRGRFASTGSSRSKRPSKSKSLKRRKNPAQVAQRRALVRAAVGVGVMYGVGAAINPDFGNSLKEAGKAASLTGRRVHGTVRRGSSKTYSGAAYARKYGGI